MLNARDPHMTAALTSMLQKLELLGERVEAMEQALRHLAEHGLTVAVHVADSEESSNEGEEDAP